MCFFRKSCILGLISLVVAMPFVASATQVVTTKEYVDGTAVQKYQGEVVDNNTVTHQYDMMQVGNTGNLERVTPVNAISSSSDGSYLPVTANAVYDSLATKEDTSNKLDASSNNTVSDYATDSTKYTSAKAVAQYAVQKPATAAAGQVLTYGTGATAASQPEAQYIKVPIATGDPSAASNAATPTGFASIWLN